MTFIALSSPLAWRLVALWIQTHLVERTLAKSDLKLSVFFSDGWEQLVVFYHRPDGESRDSIRDVYSAKKSFSEHPLVSRTETYFLLKALDCTPPTDIDFSIRFRGRTLTGRHINAARLKTALEESKLGPQMGDTWKSQFGGRFELSLYILSGLTDYEVSIVAKKPEDKTSPELMRAYKGLHKSLNDSGHISRLQTQFAFGEST
jgi:hypothetical protein